MCLYERAINVIKAVMDGSNLYISRAFGQNRGQTPLETEFMIDVSDAVQKENITTDEASKIIGRILGKLVGKTLPLGKSIAECYDLVKHRPSDEYDRILRDVKEDLCNLGLHIE